MIPLEKLEDYIVNDHYYKKYCNFILSRSKRIKSKDLYTENHHILPKCYGGLDNDLNLIRLTGREHFIAHWMLWKACGKEMLQAFWCMSHWKSQKQNRYIKINSKSYEVLREDFSKLQSKRCKGRYVSEETRKKISESNKGKYVTKETRKKQSDSSYLRNLTKEERNKAHKSLRKNLSLLSDDEKKIKYGKSKIGKKLSEETKRKISESNKGRLVKKETKQLLSELKKDHAIAKCSKTGKNLGLIHINDERWLNGKIVGQRSGIKCNQKTKDRLSKLNKGKKPFYNPNNINETLYCYPSDSPNDWVMGSVLYYMNPTNNKEIKKCPAINKPHNWKQISKKKYEEIINEL